jgi:hypothetical protein
VTRPFERLRCLPATERTNLRSSAEAPGLGPRDREQPVHATACDQGTKKKESNPRHRVASPPERRARSSKEPKKSGTSPNGVRPEAGVE